MRWSPASARMPLPATLELNRQVLSFCSKVDSHGRDRSAVTSRTGRSSRLQAAAGLDQARTEAKLMPDSDLQIPPLCQADDIGCLLNIRRNGFSMNTWQPAWSASIASR